MDNLLSTINTMLKIHEDIIYATNEPIKQTHVCHEKQIQRLQKKLSQGCHEHGYAGSSYQSHPFSSTSC